MTNDQEIPWLPEWSRTVCPYCNAQKEQKCVGPHRRVLRWPHVERHAIDPEARRNYLEHVGRTPMGRGRRVSPGIAAIQKLENAAAAGRGLSLRPSEVRKLWQQFVD